jgi:hypothetical protein
MATQLPHALALPWCISDVSTRLFCLISRYRTWAHIRPLYLGDRHFAAAGPFAFGNSLFQGVESRHPSDKQKFRYFSDIHNRKACACSSACAENTKYFSSCITFRDFRTCIASRQTQACSRHLRQLFRSRIMAQTQMASAQQAGHHTNSQTESSQQIRQLQFRIFSIHHKTAFS